MQGKLFCRNDQSGFTGRYTLGSKTGHAIFHVSFMRNTTLEKSTTHNIYADRIFFFIETSLLNSHLHCSFSVCMSL